MADLAVLGAPKDPTFSNAADEYEDLTVDLPAMALAVPPPIPKAIELTDPPDTLDFEARTAWFEERRLEYGQYLKQLELRAWLLSLDDHWYAGAATCSQDGSTLTIRINTSEGVANGMFGSPVVTDEGAAMALVSLNTGGGMAEGPGLVDSLPGWLLDIMLGDSNPRRRSYTADSN